MENFNYAIYGNRLTGAMPVVPSGNVATVEMHFIFSSDWDGLSARATFKKCGAVYEQTIVGGTVKIPAEVMRESGTFEMGVIGYESDGETVTVRISTNMIGGRVIEGAYAAGMVPGHEKDDPSDWEALMNHLTDYENPHKVKSEQLEDNPRLYGTLEIDQSREGDRGAAVEVWSAFGYRTKITPDGIVLDENGGGVMNLRDPYADTDAVPKGWAENEFLKKEDAENEYFKKSGGEIEGAMSALSGAFGAAWVSNVDTDDGHAVVNVNTVRSMMPPAATVDTEMSDTSTNAVQNKVIKAYVDSYQKKYELIEDRTLTQEARTLTFDKYSDNTAYKLSGLLVKVYTPAQPNLSAASDIIYCRVYFGTNIANFRADAALSKTAESYDVFGRFEANRGYWEYQGTKTQAYQSNPLRVATYPFEDFNSSMKYTDEDFATKIVIETISTQNEFPVGTNIKIYGIKAD